MAAIAGSLYLLIEKSPLGEAAAYLSAGIGILLMTALAIHSKINVTLGLLGAMINENATELDLCRLVSRSNRLHKAYSGLMVAGIAVLSVGVARAVNSWGSYVAPIILFLFIVLVCVSLWRTNGSIEVGRKD